MARKFPTLPSWTNVAANSTATLNLPRGVTYHAIQIDYSGVTLAQMKNIELKLNGRTFQEFKDGQRLQDFNSYFDRNVEAGRLVIWLETPEMWTLPLRRSTCIGMANINTFQISMDIDAAASAPVIDATATVSVDRPTESILKIHNWVVDNASTGIKEVSDIPRLGNIPFYFLFKADISSAELKLNQSSMYELSKAQGERIQRDYDRVPDDTKFTAVDFMLEGDPDQAIKFEGVNDFRIRPSFDTSGAADLVIGYLAKINTL